MNNEQMQDLLVQFSTVTFRLDAFEKKLDESIEKIETKVDQLVSLANQQMQKQAVIDVKVKQLDKQYSNLYKSHQDLLKDMNSMKVSLAEKLSYSTIGGGFAIVALKIIESMVGK